MVSLITRIAPAAGSSSSMLLVKSLFLLGLSLLLLVSHTANGFLPVVVPAAAPASSSSSSPRIAATTDAVLLRSSSSSSTTTTRRPMVVTQESSASKFSGAGTAKVDMNRYNLDSLEEICDEWSAVAVPATPLREAGVYLQARRNREIMADTVQVRFPRSSGGLGLELLELAGGREDGLGIVIVENVVAGGAADGSGILPGDSIVQVQVQRQSRSSSGSATASTTLDATETDESFAVETECLGYDKTVEALQSLPPAVDDDNVQEFFVLTLKRLRRKPVVQVKLQYPPTMNEPDVALELFAGENLRRALLVRGTKLNDPLAARFDSGGTGDCGAEGTCATCAVAVTDGLDLLSPPGQQEAQIFAKQPRWRMTCKAVVGHGMQEGELTVRVSPRQWDKE